MKEEKEDVAMQTRCVFCKREQYMPAVYGVSRGTESCVWCGKISKKMTWKEYRKAYGEPIEEGEL